MRTAFPPRGLLAPLLLLALLLPRPALGADTIDISMIERITGRHGTYDKKESVFKITVPRDDLSISAAGVKITAAMGLSSWAAFKKSGPGTVLTGDMVLLEGQVNPVMSVALDNGLEVTALHNHFLWETPRVMFMHIAGTGSEEALARAAARVFDKINETSGGAAVERAGIDPSASALTQKVIDDALGKKGEFTKGVYKVTFERKTGYRGTALAAAMGISSWAAFAGQDEQAVVDGDFVAYEGELQAVLKALRANGINIVAIHNHMTAEEPRLVFLHYWSIGPASKLAAGVKAALEAEKEVTNGGTFPGPPGP